MSHQRHFERIDNAIDFHWVGSDRPCGQPADIGKIIGPDYFRWAHVHVFCLCVLYLCVFVSVCAVCGQPFDIGKTVSPDYFMFACVCVCLRVCLCNDVFVCACVLSLDSTSMLGLAMRCSVLQCVAVCCSVLQCIAVCRSVLQSVAVCRSVSQCVVVCRSVLQCIVVCRSVLQCVAVAHSLEVHTHRIVHLWRSFLATH